LYLINFLLEIKMESSKTVFPKVSFAEQWNIFDALWLEKYCMEYVRDFYKINCIELGHDGLVVA